MPLAVPLLSPEGWTLEPPDLARLHELGGAVGAFEHEELVGFLTFIDTPPYRWIGNVVVGPRGRGRGTGARIVAEAMRGAPRAALYSVEKAVPLYARAGLVPHGEIFSMRADHARPGPARAQARSAGPGEEGAGHVADLGRADVDEVLALDRAATGMDRSRLLRALLDVHPGSVVRRDGKVVAYGIAKVYYDVTEIGPVVAGTPEDAWSIVDTLVAETTGPHDVAVPHDPHGGWRERGFVPSFRAVPMFTGGPPAWDLARYHAAAGLEKG